ncbi:MAG: stage II sporulation protein D [Oscillospiraceae bacterium]|nr:stage II sporulation protein D [Oscillospiraceae bacterium]
MKGKDKIWLMAIIMGVIVPGLIFSVAEKLYADKPAVDTDSSTQAAAPEHNGGVIAQEDSILVLQANGTVEKMNMDTYLTGVLLGEMPADFDEEALKAQAVVARTYAKKREQTGAKHIQGAVCKVASCCQSYCAPEDYLQKGGKQETVEKFKNAVESTTGQVLTYQEKLIEATYFSCSGGKTEDALAVWGTQIPYLQAVDSPGEENATHYQDHMQFSAQEFATRLGINPKGTPGTWFGRVTHTPGGGVDTIVIGGKVFQGVDLRQKLNLYSTAFSVVATANTVHIYTKGFGHRVGMSQYGAEAMAVSGSDYAEILSHYYPGTAMGSYLD